MEKRKIIYYSDERNDEFSTAQITPRTIDGSYVYIRSSRFRRFTHFFWYRMIFTPIAFIHSKTVHHHKIVGKECLAPFRHTGYFLYGNHTQPMGDPFMVNMLNLPKDNYIIVHPNNVSMPVLGRITPSLGALPLPDDMEAYRNFLKAVEQRIGEGHSVVIFPEAHIWPYFTGIRSFSDDSFYYPVKLDAPSFCFTNTYQKRKWSKKPRIVTYIDGPFYPDPTLPPRKRKGELRDRIYACMCERAKQSTVVRIQYIKREEQHDSHTFLRQ